jgi:PPM family protein phosphatase
MAAMGEPVFFALSERNQREKNQDALYAARVEDYAVFGIADGLGGHAHGEVAAAKAIAEIREIAGSRIFTSRSSDLLSRAFEAANHRIAAYNQEYRVNSATTLIAAIVHSSGRCTIANCGDSRASVITKDAFWHTRDHSFVQQLIDSGMLREEDAFRHPQNNILTQALGLDRRAFPDIYERDVKGKVLILSSDGMHDFVRPERIRQIALHHEPAQAAGLLVRDAVAGGSTDNITLIVSRW